MDHPRVGRVIVDETSRELPLEYGARMVETRSRSMVLGVAALGMVLAGCGSGTKPEAGPAPVATATASRAATSTTVANGPVAASPSAGCAQKQTPATPTDDKVTTTSGGESRWYLRHVPPTYVPGSPSPVVIDIHGYQEGAAIHAVMSRLGAYGDTHGFITLGPNGTGIVTHWDTALGGKDLKFIGDMLDEVEAAMCVDTNRVFVTGLSQGAFMTSAVACVYANRIGAAAPVAGVMSNIKDCKPARAVPLVTFHGTADGFVAFDGGLGKDALNLPSPDGKGKVGDQPGIKNSRKGLTIPQQVAGWAQRNGCADTPTETKIAYDVTLVNYTCTNRRDVAFYRVADGGHTWPGSEFSKTIAKVVGRTTDSINADEVMWKFFEAHPLRASAG